MHPINLVELGHFYALMKLRSMLTLRLVIHTRAWWPSPRDSLDELRSISSTEAVTRDAELAETCALREGLILARSIINKRVPSAVAQRMYGEMDY